MHQVERILEGLLIVSFEGSNRIPKHVNLLDQCGQHSQAESPVLPEQRYCVPSKHTADYRSSSLRGAPCFAAFHMTGTIICQDKKRRQNYPCCPESSELVG